ncbi:uncharacterized protein [Palaemon carinicauda]|uniref:uncharacterized protein n=1 Tax=Palaemon carinicauda TaxID=392227 RepID=UPI0035B5A587
MSNYEQLLRITSYLLKFCSRLKGGNPKKKALEYWVQHLGIGTTLNYLREQGFWIPKGRSAVKTELSSCNICRKSNALAYRYPKFTDMPKHHMNLVKPFQHFKLRKFRVITPNSIIKLHGNSSLILRKDDSDVWLDDSSQPSLEKIVEIQEEIIENFKKLWFENYLLSLREHSRNLYQSKWENRIKVGDIVLIKAINKPGPFWMMGKVLELISGFNNNIRSGKLKQGNGAIEYHSICNLYPEELSVTHAIRERPTRDNSMEIEVETGSINKPESIHVEQGERSVRPKRKATERFERMLNENLDNL